MLSFVVGQTNDGFGGESEHDASRTRQKVRAAAAAAAVGRDRRYHRLWRGGVCGFGEHLTDIGFWPKHFGILDIVIATTGARLDEQ